MPPPRGCLGRSEGDTAKSGRQDRPAQDGPAVIGRRVLATAVMSGRCSHACLFRKRWRLLHGYRCMGRPHRVVARRTEQVCSKHDDGNCDEEHAKGDRWQDSHLSLALLRHGHILNTPA